jgi:hypothetical protein
VPREGVDLGALQAAHDAVLALQQAGSGPQGLLPWSVLTTTSAPLTAPPAGAEWIPWLHRVMALQQWVVGGVRPEVVFGTTTQLPVELRGWPGGHGDPMTTTQSGITSSPAPAPQPAAPSAAEASMPPASMPSPAGSVPASAGLPTVPGPTRAPSKIGSAVRAGVLVVGAAAMLGLAVAGAPAWAFAVAVTALLALLAWTVRWLRNASAVVAPPVAWTARVVETTGSSGVARIAALDVAVALHDDRGTVMTNVPMRVRRTDAFAGLDALRQPPVGTALSSPLPRTPVLQRTWLEVSVANAWPC